jgi:hypothetical protein
MKAVGRRLVGRKLTILLTSAGANMNELHRLD